MDQDPLRSEESEEVFDEAQESREPEATGWEFSIHANDSDSAMEAAYGAAVDGDFDWGHAWISMIPKGNPVGGFGWGLYPQGDVVESRPWESVAGAVQFDLPRGGDFVATWDISEEKGDEVNQAAFEAHASPPAYNLLTYNCADFAIDMAERAGVDPPSGSTLGVAIPHELISDLKARAEEDETIATSGISAAADEIA